ALIERWNLEKNTFYLPTGKMTVTLEDVFRILRLPITGRPVYQAGPSMARGAITVVFGSAAQDLTQRGLTFTYGIMYATHLEATRLAVVLMIVVGYYALPRVGGGRFPKALMCIIWEMIERSVTFAWAPAYLAELYR
ncbi:hypothetical protein KI387_038026, partial [Taxus chinensis]